MSKPCDQEDMAHLNHDCVASLEELIQKAWIFVTLQEFRDQYGDAIFNRLTSAIYSRQRSGDIQPVLHEWGTSACENLVAELEDEIEIEKEVERRFYAKVVSFGSVIRHAIFGGLQGSVAKLQQIDTNDFYLKKMVLDLVANSFISELRPTAIEFDDLEQRALAIKKQIENWEKGLEPVRLVAKSGGWVDSHSLVVAID